MQKPIEKKPNADAKGTFRIESKQLFPRNILPKILQEIGIMFRMYKLGLVRGTEGSLIRDNGVYGVMIKTRFHQSTRKRGILFHVYIMIRDYMRRVGSYLSQVPFETLKATIIIRPSPQFLASLGGFN